MKQHPFQRFRLHPIVMPTIVAFLLLAANIVPRVQVGLPVFLDPSSRKLPPCNGVSHYGWPKTARVDEFIQYSNIAPASHYSLRHLIGAQEVGIQRTQTSMFTHFSNFVFVLALVLLIALTMRVLSDRRVTTKVLFTAVSLFAVMFASFNWGASLSTSEPLANSLQWYTAENCARAAEPSHAPESRVGRVFNGASLAATAVMRAVIWQGRRTE